MKPLSRSITQCSKCARDDGSMLHFLFEIVTHELEPFEHLINRVVSGKNSSFQAILSCPMYHII